MKFKKDPKIQSFYQSWHDLFGHEIWQFLAEAIKSPKNNIYGTSLGVEYEVLRNMKVGF